MYERDEQRSLRQEYRRADVVQQTINLDSFTMMNATYTKEPFTSKTLSEVFNHLSTMLNVKLPYNQTYSSEWHKFNHFVVKLSNIEVSKYQKQLSGDIALLKYQVAIFGIFVERLLNKNWKLTAENIERESQTMTKIMEFFTEWKSEIADSNMEDKISNTVGEKITIAKKHTTT